MNRSAKSLALAIALALSVPAFAVEKPFISGVTEASGSVTINGAHFLQQKGQLQVYVSGVSTPLVVASYTDNAIVALLPAGVAPGGYLFSLVKTRGDGGDGTANDGDEFYFTLGAQGAKGDKGDAGEVGPQGPAGQTGLKGDTGPAGAQGTAGTNGTPGARGDTGATGAQGPKGDTGATGAQGPKGDTGATGAQGPKGDTGATGGQGPKGDTGATGATGAQGPPGVQGPAGGSAPDYDSGWFTVNQSSGEITLTTGLGSVPSQLMLHQCGQLNANGQCATRTVIAGTTGYHDTGATINPLGPATSDGTNIYLSVTSGLWVYNYWTPTKGWNCPTTNCFAGFWRVMAWK